MRKASMVASGLITVSVLLGIGGCADGPEHRKTTMLMDKTCDRSTPCSHAVQVRSPGVALQCAVAFPYATTTVPGEIDIYWTLPWRFIGHLEFTDPGVEFKSGRSASNDFTNGRFGDDRGTYIWTSTSAGKRTGKPFDYRFGVIWVSPFFDPVKCGVIDPTIVNSL